MNTGATKALDELRADARLCKNRHFAAADRKQKYHIYCGIPVMIMTIFTGTVLVNVLSSASPPVVATATATVLAFVSATLSGLQTFFNFHKASEGHRSVANRYQEIARRCKHLIQQGEDVAHAPDKIWIIIEQLRIEYAEINTEAEAFMTSDSDLAKARGKPSITPFNAKGKNEPTNVPPEPLNQL